MIYGVAVGERRKRQIQMIKRKQWRTAVAAWAERLRKTSVLEYYARPFSLVHYRTLLVVFVACLCRGPDQEYVMSDNARQYRAVKSHRTGPVRRSR